MSGRRLCVSVFLLKSLALFEGIEFLNDLLPVIEADQSHHHDHCYNWNEKPFIHAVEQRSAAPKD